MYTVMIGQAKALVFETKETLINYYVAQDAASYINPETYTPKVFTDVAMNGNDRRSMGCSKILGEEFSPMWFKPVQQARKTIVRDGDGRIIDIRTWLPEFRTAMKAFLKDTAKSPFVRSKLCFSGSKPTFRKTCQVSKGFKQKQMRPEEVDCDEILQYMSAMPVQMTRREAHKFDDRSFRNRSRSWKDQSKCRKSWQRRAAQTSARQIHQRDWLDETKEVELEMAKFGHSADNIELVFGTPVYASEIESDFMDADDELFLGCRLSA